jgi:hypothetical protein
MQIESWTFNLHDSSSPQRLQILVNPRQRQSPDPVGQREGVLAGVDHVHPFEMEMVEGRPDRGGDARGGGALQLEANTPPDSHHQEVELDAGVGTSAP